MHESSILGAYMEGVVQYEQRAYLRSVTGRRGTSQKDPYPSRTRTKRRAAHDEYRALGDLGRRSPRISRDSGMLYHRTVVGKGLPFKLRSVLSEQPPAGAEGIGWHRYVITHGDNSIVGHRQGSTRGVTLAVEEIVLHLNERKARKVIRTTVSPYPYRNIRSPT